MTIAALNDQVLVLNKSWTAVGLASAMRALTLIFTEKAEAIDVDQDKFYNFNFGSWTEASEFKEEFEKQNYNWIKSALLTIAVPKIIRLVEYNEFRRRVPRLTRRNIFSRDNNTCQYCGRKFKSSDLSIDHIIPKSRGGVLDWPNVACACIKCNVKKADRTPKEAGMKLIRRPKAPEHSFVFNCKTRHKSWEHFIDAAYWNVELQD
ncbi:MAG: HNH endonuclease [Anaerolineales bacterium]|jgi:5-methylcytosine-specific restriction endonuclease McrA|nr:HNH endonuclease [Anaerolineales bacterium]